MANKICMKMGIAYVMTVLGVGLSSPSAPIMIKAIRPATAITYL
jgi:hypothetical protein